MITIRGTTRLKAIGLAFAVSMVCSATSPAWCADLKLGFDFSLTGGTDDFGKAARMGAMLALKEYNAKGGYKGQKVEAVLYAHPQVLDAAVFGIPDDEWGESVYAVIQAKPGESMDLEELRGFIESRVARYKRPRQYELRDELPRTDAGKLLKRVLRDEFWQGRAAAV